MRELIYTYSLYLYKGKLKKKYCEIGDQKK